MQAFLYYLFYPLIYLIASLPFGIMYAVSDFFYWVLRLSGYRKKVILTNLRNSFPEKTEAEIQILFRDFCHHLCDIVFETLKTLTMTEKEARARCVFHKAAWLDQLFAEQKSVIVLLGHYGNWEWAGPSFTLNNDCQLVVIYRPLSNVYFEKMMYRMRTKFGTRIAPAAATLREMVANRGKKTATALIADQSAFGDGYWTTFLNQETAVYNGPEKLARKFNYPVVYMHVSKPRRGYYEVRPELLFSRPVDTAEGEILETFTRKLEEEIIARPSLWLWSHRRWKYKRPAQ